MGERKVGQRSEEKGRRGEGKRDADHSRSYKSVDVWQTTCQDGEE